MADTMTAQQQGLANNSGIAAGQAGSPWTVAPPNPSSPVPTDQITNGGPLNFPPTPPSDNGAGLVASAIGGLSNPVMTPSSSTPSFDQSIGGTGDYTQDPNYQKALQGLGTSQSIYSGAVSSAPTATSILDTAQGQFGLNDKLTTLNNANADLAATKAKYDVASQQAETQGIQTGTPTVYYQGQQAAIQRQAAVDVGAKAAIQAAAQGNYDRAQSLANQTAEFRYKDVQDKINRLKDFVAMNQENLNSAEKKAIQRIDAQQKLQQIKLDQQKQVFTWKLTYPMANIGENDSLAQAAKKAAAWVAQNPYAGQKPTVIGSHYDEMGNKIDTYGLVGANGQIKPLDYNSSQGNMNLGMSTGTIQGLPTYNTQDNNPGVSRPVRNNNPGNIKVSATSASYAGVVGVEATPAADGGHFLIFASPQDGLNAIGQLLLNGASYKNVTAEQAIKKYNGGGGYGAADVGLNPNQNFQEQLKDPAKLQSVTEQIAKHEGFNVSSNQSSNGALGTMGTPNIDTAKPGYATNTVGGTGMTQAAVDQQALAYALGDTSVLSSRSAKGQPQLQKKAIMNRAAEINTSGNIAANKEQLKALSASLTEQTKYLSTVDRSLSNAEDGFKQITDAFSKSGINPTDSKYANTKINDYNNLFGKNQEALRAFQAGLYEVQNEYAQVFSRGGQRTLEGNKEAQDLLNGNLSISSLMAIQKELQAQGEIVKNGSQAQVQKLQDQINKIIDPNAKTSSNVTTYNFNGKNYVKGSDGLFYEQ